MSVKTNFRMFLPLFITLVMSSNIYSQGILKDSIIAYTDSSHNLKIRYTEDGFKWVQANLDKNYANVYDPYIARDPTGFVTLVVWHDHPTGGAIFVVTGLGAHIVGDARNTMIQCSGKYISATSCGVPWVISFVDKGSIYLGLLSNSFHVIKVIWIAPDEDLVGNPAIVYSDANSQGQVFWRSKKANPDGDNYINRVGYFANTAGIAQNGPVIDHMNWSTKFDPQAFAAKDGYHLFYWWLDRNNRLNGVTAIISYSGEESSPISFKTYVVGSSQQINNLLISLAPIGDKAILVNYNQRLNKPGDPTAGRFWAINKFGVSTGDLSVANDWILPGEGGPVGLYNMASNIDFAK